MDLRSGLQRSLVTFPVTGLTQAHEQPCATTARPLLVAVAQRAFTVQLMQSGPCMNMQALPALRELQYQDYDTGCCVQVLAWTYRPQSQDLILLAFTVITHIGLCRLTPLKSRTGHVHPEANHQTLESKIVNGRLTLPGQSVAKNRN